MNTILPVSFDYQGSGGYLGWLGVHLAIQVWVTGMVRALVAATETSSSFSWENDVLERNASQGCLNELGDEEQSD